jgi:hypothetical protein
VRPGAFARRHFLVFDVVPLSEPPWQACVSNKGFPWHLPQITMELTTLGTYAFPSPADQLPPKRVGMGGIGRGERAAGVSTVELPTVFEEEDPSSVQSKSRYSLFCVGSVIFTEDVERSNLCERKQKLEEIYTDTGQKIEFVGPHSFTRVL